MLAKEEIIFLIELYLDPEVKKIMTERIVKFLKKYGNPSFSSQEKQLLFEIFFGLSIKELRNQLFKDKKIIILEKGQKCFFRKNCQFVSGCSGAEGSFDGEKFICHLAELEKLYNFPKKIYKNKFLKKS